MGIDGVQAGKAGEAEEGEEEEADGVVGGEEGGKEADSVRELAEEGDRPGSDLQDYILRVEAG